MPDSITPVGALARGPDPQQGLSNLSSLIGLAQQKQQLQTGAFQQQTAQAEATQAQQRSQELQAAQSLVFNGAKSGKYTLPDGTLNRAKMAQDIATVAPTYGGPAATSLLSQANEIVANQQAHQNLTVARKKEISDTFQMLAADPGLDNTKFIDAIEMLRQQHPNDPEFSRMLTSMSTHMPNTGDPQTLRTLAANWAAAGSGESPLQQTTNAAGQIINRNKFTGELSPAAIAGQGSSKPSDLNPSTPQVAGRTIRETATGSADVDRANEVGGLQQSSSAAIELTKQIDRLAEDINSGKVAKMISETGNYFGLSSINQARSQLNKDLGQVKGLAIARSGSDARAATVLEGYPTDTTPTETTHAAMDYIRGTARQNLARGQVLAQYQKQDPQGLRGFQAADNIVTGQTNPLMHEFLALPANQRAGFYKRNFGSAQEAQAFKNQVSALQRHTRVLGQ